MKLGILLFCVLLTAAVVGIWLIRRRHRDILPDDMEGHEFERYCAELLEENGFQEVEVTKGSGDYGVDILAEKDGITYAIQCKRYTGPVGVAQYSRPMRVGTIMTGWWAPY